MAGTLLVASYATPEVLLGVLPIFASTKPDGPRAVAHPCGACQVDSGGRRNGAAPARRHSASSALGRVEGAARLACGLLPFRSAAPIPGDVPFLYELVRTKELMMNLIPWKNRPAMSGSRSPISPVSRARFEVDQLFDRMLQDPWGLWSATSEAAEFAAPLDVQEKGSELIVKVDLPGVDPKAVDVSVDGNMLTISGERKSEQTSEGDGWRHMERRFGSFQRTLQLPDSIDAESVEADHTNGVLSVRFKKVPATQARKVEIKTST